MIAGAASVIIAAAAAGVWAGSRGRTPRPIPIDVSAPVDPTFLPATDSAAEQERQPADAKRGAALFEERCATCHTIGGGERKGPDLAVAAAGRDPFWVDAMIAYPDSMFAADSIAQWILKVHDLEPAQATSENPDFRALVAFLRGLRPGR